MIGRLIKKTTPQSNLLRRNPPIIGPIANPAAKVAANIPIACANCFGFKNKLLRMASPDGNNVAPPSPIIARLIINIPGLEENAAQSEPIPKVIEPNMINFSLP